ncbi:MAG: hypothetical protein IT299_06335 [Dehalococcoidia bacterium]|nr:hypothetical protein [Dehalococcoidia bacterium]
MTTQLTLPPNLHVDVFDESGGRLLGRAMLLFEPAPIEGLATRGWLQPDRDFGLVPGIHHLRLPSNEGWQVELQASERPGAYSVVAPSTPVSVSVGGE